MDKTKGSSPVEAKSKMTYQTIVDLSFIVEAFNRQGKISKKLRQEYLQRMRTVTESLCIENDIVVLDGSELSKIPMDTVLKEISFNKFQNVCYWILERSPALDEYLKPID